MTYCIGLASGIGAGNSDCDKGPLYLKQHLKLDDALNWKQIIIPENLDRDKIDLVASMNEKLAQQSYALALKEPFFMSFGGDHSSAIGTWSGVAEAKRQEGDIGLIWIDAHMDAHTPETTPSGNIHGMPLAVLLGHGDKKLTGILSNLPKIKPENLFLIGVRSYEEGESALLEKLNVKVYFMEEVQRRGFKVILDEVLKILASRTVGYGISFDLDAIDPIDIKAVGTPIPDGIRAAEALDAMEPLSNYPPLAFEIVEYNPELDINLETFNFTENLLKTVFRFVGAVK
jgi:arginase